VISVWVISERPCYVSNVSDQTEENETQQRTGISPGNFAGFDPAPRIGKHIGKHYQKTLFQRGSGFRMRGTEASMLAEIQISPELSIQIGSEEWRKMRSKHRFVCA
jgi:hypothetical protein